MRGWNIQRFDPKAEEDSLGSSISRALSWVSIHFWYYSTSPWCHRGNKFSWSFSNSERILLELPSYAFQYLRWLLKKNGWVSTGRHIGIFRLCIDWRIWLSATNTGVNFDFCFFFVIVVWGRLVFITFLFYTQI